MHAVTNVSGEAGLLVGVQAQVFKDPFKYLGQAYTSVISSQVKQFASSGSGVSSLLAVT